ncbi:MAG: hypothetical protein H7Y37_09340 [Anaerolineae bacterium]|nr:hypothetical protein [Gloeobacterales cyanobacterium ES-bin-313]
MLRREVGCQGFPSRRRIGEREAAVASFFGASLEVVWVGEGARQTL